MPTKTSIIKTTTAICLISMIIVPGRLNAQTIKGTAPSGEQKVEKTSLPKGYQSVTWGMSKETVKAKLKLQIVAQDTGSIKFKSKDGGRVECSFKEGKLAGVIKTERMNHKRVLLLETSLLEKYGDPVSINEKENDIQMKSLTGIISSKNIVWKDASTEINYVVMHYADNDSVIISYSDILAKSAAPAQKTESKSDEKAEFKENY